MAICTICKQRGGPHRMKGKPCGSHRNEVCFDCWKQHLADIVEKGATITCVECTKPLNKGQVKDGAPHIYEHLTELMNIAAAEKTAKAKKSVEKAEDAVGEDSAGGADDAGDEEFVIVEKHDAYGGDMDDWELVNDDM